MIRFALICITLFLFSGCGNKNDRHDEEPVARVYDEYLYPSDLKDLITSETDSHDSARIVSEFIDNWIRHNLELKIAEANIESVIDDIDRQAAEYRQSLIIYAYERQWLKEKLDTVIPVDSLESYFNRNQQDFILKSDIYRLSYAVLEKSTGKKDSLKMFFEKGLDKFQGEAELFCAANCSDYSIRSGAWVSEDALFTLLPLDMYGNGKFRSAGVTEYEDETSYYIVYIDAWHPAGSISPFEYNKNAIGDIIINRRKIALLKENQMNMYEQAMKKNNAEIYGK